jgi:hypothetical protein
MPWRATVARPPNRPRSPIEGFAVSVPIVFAGIRGIHRSGRTTVRFREFCE